MSNQQEEDSLRSSTSYYRPPISANKRSRDPSQRKSVSFNDVPIVHEVPSNEPTRTSNNETYRSWTFTDATLVSDTNSPIVTVQKLIINRLPDSPNKSKLSKSLDERTTLSPLIDAHPPDEKRYSYRAAIVPETHHYRNVSFSSAAVSQSATTYTNILSTSLMPSTDLNIPITGHPRATRVRSATLPHSTRSSNDSLSLSSHRSPISTHSSRAILKPTTIALSNTSTHLSPSKSTRINSSNSHHRYLSPANRFASSASPTSKQTDPFGPLPPTTLLKKTRSRSANVVTNRRHANSPTLLSDRSSAASSNSNLFATSKRNPNVRQTYGSYYMHRVLLPGNIN